MAERNLMKMYLNEAALTKKKYSFGGFGYFFFLGGSYFKTVVFLLTTIIALVCLVCPHGTGKE